MTFCFGAAKLLAFRGHETPNPSKNPICLFVNRSSSLAFAGQNWFCFRISNQVETGNQLSHTDFLFVSFPFFLRFGILGWWFSWRFTFFLFWLESLVEPKKAKRRKHEQPVTGCYTMIQTLVNANHKSNNHEGKEHHIKKSQSNRHAKSGLPAQEWCRMKNLVWLSNPFLSGFGLG